MYVIFKIVISFAVCICKTDNNNRSLLSKFDKTKESAKDEIVLT